MINIKYHPKDNTTNMITYTESQKNHKLTFFSFRENNERRLTTPETNASPSQLHGKTVVLPETQERASDKKEMAELILSPPNDLNNVATSIRLTD